MSSLPRLAVAFVLLASTALAADSTKPDPWQPVRFLVGEWEGIAEGQPGKGTVARSYAFVLANRFIEERNVSRYDAMGPGKPGEMHEHRGFLSYDKKRGVLVLRQFHEESFVNTYAMRLEVSTPKKLVFESESFENFDNSWKARETYDVISEDEFIETFELAAPGAPYEVYSRNHFKRSAVKAE